MYQERVASEQQLSELATASEASQNDILALSQALDEAQKLLDDRSAEHEGQISGLQTILAEAEQAFSTTSTALKEAQVRFQTSQIHTDFCLFTPKGCLPISLLDHSSSSSMTVHTEVLERGNLHLCLETLNGSHAGSNIHLGRGVGFCQSAPCQYKPEFLGHKQSSGRYPSSAQTG